MTQSRSSSTPKVASKDCGNGNRAVLEDTTRLRDFASDEWEKAFNSCDETDHLQEDPDLGNEALLSQEQDSSPG